MHGFSDSPVVPEFAFDEGPGDLIGRIDIAANWGLKLHAASAVVRATDFRTSRLGNGS